MSTNANKRDAIAKIILGADNFSGLLDEVKRANPDDLVASNALARSLAHKESMLKEYQVEHMGHGVTDTTKQDLDNAITLVSTVAEKIPDAAREPHLNDPVVAEVDARIKQNSEFVSGAVATRVDTAMPPQSRAAGQ